MKILRYIPLSILTVLFSAYDTKFAVDSAPWDIFYFATIYFCLMLMCIRETYGSKDEMFFFGAFS